MKFGQMPPDYVPPRPTGIESRIPDEPPMCSTCGEDYATTTGRCRRCNQSLEDDRYERECGR